MIEPQKRFNSKGHMH